MHVKAIILDLKEHTIIFDQYGIHILPYLGQCTAVKLYGCKGVYSAFEIIFNGYDQHYTSLREFARV